MLGRSGVRIRGVLFLLLVLVATASGCGRGVEQGGRDVDEDAARQAVVERNQRIGDQLAAEWSGLPQVVEADTGYAWNPEDKSFRAAVVCRGCDVDALFDRVVGDVWRSRLTQMPAFVVEVWDGDDPERGKSRTFTVPEDSDLLEESYGPRRVG
jgi:hypothetical protein